MLWNGILIIGVLLVANGIILSVQGRIVEKLRSELRAKGELTSGVTKGLLFLTTCEAILAVDGHTVMEAYLVRSGFLRPPTKKAVPELAGQSILGLEIQQAAMTRGEKRACELAAFWHNRAAKR